MSLRTGEVDRAWAKLGFTILDDRADVRAILYVDGRQILRTYRSHGSGKIEGNIPHKIRTQMKLNESQFEEAIQCPLKADGYLEILSKKGLLG